jgi:hypothetical protein
MTNCIYKETNRSCAHPGNRNCCAAEEIHKLFLECDKNEEMGEFFHVTKEKFHVLLKTLSQELVVE